MNPDSSAVVFPPSDLDVANLDRLLPWYQQLLDRPIASPAELETWLLDYSNLTAQVSEFGSRRHIDKSRQTDDPEIHRRFLHFIETIQPRIKPLDFQLQRKFLDCPHRAGLSEPQYQVMGREWQNEVDLFRQENIPLQTQTTKLCSQYDQICGKMIVDFRGQSCTLQQLARYGEEQDRTLRQQAWEVAEQRRSADVSALDELFNQLIQLRNQIARQSDCSDYRAYLWKSYNRFDYTPDDCLRFADAIEKACLPVVDRLNRQRAADLGLEKLRPWDLAVDPQGQAPLRPFPADDMDRFVAGAAEIFHRISPQLGEQFRQLKPGHNLDLDTRPHKRPGGYQASLEVVREPFIFMNAAGVQRDVETLLHEGGHAFHYLQSRRVPLVFLRHAPIEFCEVASMSMELLGDDHLGVYYGNSPQGQADAARAKRNHLEGIIRIFPWIACIDLFQHWLYTHPDHTPDQRQEAWLQIHQRFSSTTVDWTGLENTRRSLWQRQIHLFHHPFYYVEYGIAQLGALQVWHRYQQQPDQALSDLLSAFALGGTRPLRTLFETAGVKLDFSAATLEPLIEQLETQLTPPTV